MEDRDIEIKRRRRRRKRRRDAAIVLGILFIIAALIIYGVFALVRSMVTKSRAEADAKAAGFEKRRGLGGDHCNFHTVTPLLM